MYQLREIAAKIKISFVELQPTSLINLNINVLYRISIDFAKLIFIWKQISIRKWKSLTCHKMLQKHSRLWKDSYNVASVKLSFISWKIPFQNHSKKNFLFVNYFHLCCAFFPPNVLNIHRWKYFSFIHFPIYAYLCLRI